MAGRAQGEPRLLLALWSLGKLVFRKDSLSLTKSLRFLLISHSHCFLSSLNCPVKMVP